MFSRPGFWLSISGRINRVSFISGVLFLIFAPIVVLFIVLILVPEGNISPEDLAIAMFLATLWPFLALHVKRLHDCNRSGWFLLILFVPIIGILFVSGYTFLVKGTDGPNRFDDDDTSDVAKTLKSSIRTEQEHQNVPVIRSKTFHACKDFSFNCLLLILILPPLGMIFFFLFELEPMELRIVAQMIVVGLGFLIMNYTASISYIITASHLEVKIFFGVVHQSIPLCDIQEIAANNDVFLIGFKAHSSFDKLAIKGNFPFRTYISPSDEREFFQTIIERSTRLKQVEPRKLLWVR